MPTKLSERHFHESEPTYMLSSVGDHSKARWQRNAHHNNNVSHKSRPPQPRRAHRRGTATPPTKLRNSERKIACRVACDNTEKYSTTFISFSCIRIVDATRSRRRWPTSTKYRLYASSSNSGKSTPAVRLSKICETIEDREPHIYMRESTSSARNLAFRCWCTWTRSNKNPSC